MATIYCMNCGNPMEEGSYFCPTCGSPTLLGAGLIEPTTKAKAACPECGALVDADAVSCPECGALFGRAQPIVGSIPATIPVHTRNEREASPSHAAVAVLTVGLLCAACVLGVLGFRMIQGLTSPATQTETPVVVDVPRDDSSNDSDMGTAGTDVREHMGDYSWQELSIIGKELSRQPSREEALKLAAEYHLVDGEGKMTADTKDATLPDGSVVTMRLVDVYHDDLANGEGKAGLTLMATNLPLTHNMNTTNDITGGWEASTMRAWLNDEIYPALDEELRNAIVAVDKRSDNVGYSTSVSCVTSTIDYLWIPAMVELVGPLDWTWPSDPGNSSNFNAIMNAEGEQYALFAQTGTSQMDGNPILVLAGPSGSQTWWERSCSCSGTANYRVVNTSGNAGEIYGAANEFGVCISFCL